MLRTAAATAAAATTTAAPTSPHRRRHPTGSLSKRPRSGVVLLLIAILLGSTTHTMLPASARAAASAAGRTALRRSSSSSAGGDKVTTIVFDVDDTLYDVASGFTAHRNGEVVWRFMVDRLGFPDTATARAVRDEYFAVYHSTAKALTVARAEGRFPEGAPAFDPKDLSSYWVDHLDYGKLFGTRAHPTEEAAKKAKAAFGAALAECPCELVAFSNGPRSYVLKVLDRLSLLELFGTGRSSRDGALVWGVDDVLPHCKPEAAAFSAVFGELNAKRRDAGHHDEVVPEECVMVEDSMKNLRAAKALGMKTVLITGTGEEGRILPGDAPSSEDPAVDAAFATVEEMVDGLPGLWRDPPVFEPPKG
ncbi:unnamed protein product [Pseudo-nitzschia multistriata]|uniref:Uncharacterized protein n=1 Tax=Pseudo-nitzschia multistriata TaxID=183589 RepID=A0A448ZQX8_9STRA|nr:unnamed protein product [Pseudo-nitzschia multistriata]